ncbi:MAG: hypothetical protein M1835_001202 [Candelina submexicana]|nr:MAG: hypothetical protein M1835_001202 [Candelina submexicana]
MYLILTFQLSSATDHASFLANNDDMADFDPIDFVSSSSDYFSIQPPERDIIASFHNDGASNDLEIDHELFRTLTPESWEPFRMAPNIDSIAAPTQLPSIDLANHRLLTWQQPLGSPIDHEAAPELPLPTPQMPCTDLEVPPEVSLLTPPLTRTNSYTSEPDSTAFAAAPAPAAAAVAKKLRPAKRRRTDEEPTADAEPPKPRKAYKPRAPKPQAGETLFMAPETTKPGEHLNVVRNLKVKEGGDSKGKTMWEGGELTALSRRKAHEDKARMMALIIGRARIGKYLDILLLDKDRGGWTTTATTTIRVANTLADDGDDEKFE